MRSASTLLTIWARQTLHSALLLSPAEVLVLKVLLRYTHKTSGFKTSGFKTSGFKTSETSGLQNVRFTKRQVYKMSDLQNVRSSKRPVAKKTSTYILYLWLVEIRRFCCSHVCRQSDGCVLFSVLEVILPYITIISNNDTLITLNRNANLALPVLFV